jgi:hypothetical protein
MLNDEDLAKAIPALESAEEQVIERPNLQMVC